MPKSIYINEAAYVEGMIVTGITSLSTAISSEISVRGSSDTSLSTTISTETSTRATADTSLSTAVSTEISTRGLADTSLSTSLSSRISTETSLSTAVSTEISTRGSADTSLSTAISTRISTDTSLSTAVSTEASTRGSADTSLSTSLSSRISTETSLSTTISTETSTRGTADTSLSTAISTEASTRGSADTSLSTAISGEASTRSSADTSLTTTISTEISTRGSADTSLTTTISTEISTRGSADTSLSTATLQPWVDINRCGFLNNNETSISFNDTTYTFTLADTGSGWSYYRGGLKYTISGNKTVTLPGTPPATGTYFITLDSTDGTIIQSTTGWTLTDLKLPVATIRWNNSNTPKYHMAEERHSVLIDRRMHKYLHETSGTRFVSGGVLTGPTVQSATDADNTLGVSETTIADEDLIQVLSGLTRPNGTTNAYNIYYRTSTTGWTWQPSEVPFKYTTIGFVEYDNNGTMTAGSANNFYNTYLLFTDQNLTARFSIVSGRGQFSSLALAQAENPLTFDWTGLPIAESIIAYQLTWETSNSYGSKGKCRLSATPIRINISTTTTVGSGSGTDHNTLSGLQGGTSGQYYHLTNIDYITVTGISSALSSEISSRTSFDTSLSTGISTELSTRGSADTSLSTAISTSNSTRSSADTSLSTAISSETSVRTSTDTSLSTAINNISGGTNITNYGDDRLLTSNGTVNGIIGESNLKFDGANLSVTGSTIIDASSYYYLGTPFTENSWRWFININGELEFQRCNSGVYTYKNKMV